MRTLILGLICWLVALPAAASVLSTIAPVVVVFPLTVNGSTDPEAGGRLALLFATRLSDAGGVTVKPATPGVDRAHFLEAAKAEGADYYVTGYLTPLGDSVSLVSQVVSTYSGIVVWSSTIDIRTYAEASGQADLMRDAIVRHAGRTLAALDQPAPVPASTPAPSASSKPNEANLSHLFARKPKSTPAPASGAAPKATPAPSAVASVPVASRPLPTPAAFATRPPPPRPPPVPGPNAGAIVVAINGAATETERAYAAGVLSAAIAKAGLGGTLVSSRTTSDAAAHAGELCASNRVGAIYGGTLALKRLSSLFTPTASADFELVRYDCSGSVTARERAVAQGSGRTDTSVAIDRAVVKTLDALRKSKPTR